MEVIGCLQHPRHAENNPEMPYDLTSAELLIKTNGAEHSLTSVTIKCDKYTEALVAIFSPRSAQSPVGGTQQVNSWLLYGISRTTAVMKVLFCSVLQVDNVFSNNEKLLFR